VTRRLSPRELAYCGLFGAAALLLPPLFHVLQLGRVFMPMYLPLMVLAFLVRPMPAALTALLVPPLSGALTGMPPFFPPTALFMALELAAMASLVAWSRRVWPRANEWLVLAAALAFGRVAHVGMVYGFSRLVELPAGFLAGLSLVSGWPGVVLMLVVVPPTVRLATRTGTNGARSPREETE